MARAGDPVLEELHRAVSASGSVSTMMAIQNDSSYSLNQEDVGGIGKCISGWLAVGHLPPLSVD